MCNRFQHSKEKKVNPSFSLRPKVVQAIININKLLRYESSSRKV